MYKFETIDNSYNSFVKDIQKHFQSSTSTIHKARNEIKIINNFVVKSFKKPSFLKSIIYSLTPSKAKRSYLYSLKLKEFAPKPIGYIEFYKNNLLQDSYFVSEKFEYDFTIREVLLDKNFKDRKKILKEFANFSYRLHNNDILHLDYSPGNILIRVEQGEYIFKVVDLNRMKFKKLTIKDRMKNFAKLWISDDDLKIVVSEYEELIGVKNLYKEALKFSHALKKKVNFKKRLKGIEVVD